MNALNLDQLREQYQVLHTRYQDQEINQDQFIATVHQLRALDSEGFWWTIQPETGAYLKYQDGSWQSASPPRSSNLADQPPQQNLPKSKKKANVFGCLSSPLMVGVMSFGSAGLWLIYSNIRAEKEIWDFFTPLIMGGVPFLLRLYQERIDGLLKSVYQVTTQFPFAMRTGAAFALPVVLGLVTSTMNSSGYGALRLTTLVSIVGGYILTRKVG